MFAQSSIRLHAAAFVIFSCICLVTTDVWQTLKARDVQLEEAKVGTFNLSRAAAQQAEDVIKESDTVLVGIVERIEYEGASAASTPRMHNFLASLTRELPQLAGIFLYDEHGNWLATSQTTLATDFNNSDREYFAYHRTHDDRGAYVAGPVHSRSTGKWILPVSRRINKADGSFGGVALATISIEFFKHFYDSLDIGQAGAILLMLETGSIVVRRPFSDDFVGKDLNSSPLLQMYRSQGTVGTLTIASSQDGVLRLISYCRLKRYPLFVAAALSEDEMLAEWRRNTRVHSAGLAVLIAAVGIFGWRLTRQIRLRSQAESKVIRTQKELQRANETLERLAMQDGLTGLANRRRLDLTLNSQFSHAALCHDTLALIMLDVDRFKRYNDTRGHAAGDDCLRAIASVIQVTAASRPGDLVARYGGEEFAVVLPGADADGAMAVAEKIRRAVQDMAMPHVGTAMGVVTISAGVVSLIPQPGQKPSHLLEAADRALYAAKTGGRNRVSYERDPVSSRQGAQGAR
ncbi:sensor domain-containing diguanylate cyclase [Paraburkholderia strydomiana]|uniref:sensor domain-containing diguanylate cyclase n=1 Tax=Paraburkholderia strydomiana TaxID=1245417 RepID=UPI001BEA1D8E|nr:sensor domain-containing diguanylate cyclase [Paraburkholderia strydomiana]MBT2792946.1 sensor domain-containing diguanylate cyclase [Paraburkholderia strydomiana]